VFYVVRLLLDDDVPTNAGCLEPVLVTIPPGSLLDPVRPAPVAGGNVETSQRVVDVLLAALHPAAPDRIPAASQGTMNNLTVGGGGERPFTFYETIGGGAGAGPRGGGASGIQTHMTNTLNTPVEALESAFPVIVTRYHRRNRSGGSGRHRGGDGLVREILARAPIQVTVLASRRHEGAPGLLGGGRGRPGRDRYREGRGPWRAFPRSGTVRLETGDSVRVETPGGGGYGLTRRRRTGKGRPLRRPRK
jgi:N-methylhydantoinase B